MAMNIAAKYLIGLAAIVVYFLGVGRLQQDALQQSLVAVLSDGPSFIEGPSWDNSNHYHRLPVAKTVSQVLSFATPSPANEFSKFLLNGLITLTHSATIGEEFSNFVKAQQQYFGLTIRKLIYPSHYHW